MSENEKEGGTKGGRRQKEGKEKETEGDRKVETVGHQWDKMLTNHTEILLVVLLVVFGNSNK